MSRMERSHLIFTREILNNKFTNPDLTPVSSEDLESLSNAVTPSCSKTERSRACRDRLMYSLSPRECADRSSMNLTFYSFGWDLSQVVWTSERAVLEHPFHGFGVRYRIRG